MEKRRNHWNEIITCVNDRSQKAINCGSKKRRKAISYIDKRLKKLEQFIIAIDELETITACNTDLRRRIRHLINESKFELNEDLFNS